MKPQDERGYEYYETLFISRGKEETEDAERRREEEGRA